MNCCCLRIAMCMAVLSCIIMGSHAVEVLYDENFDRQGAKPGQSVLVAPTDWQLIGPNDVAKKSVGDVSLDACKYSLTGNYLEGGTAAAPNAENAFRKSFATVINRWLDTTWKPAHESGT